MILRDSSDQTLVVSLELRYLIYQYAFMGSLQVQKYVKHSINETNFCSKFYLSVDCEWLRKFAFS